jgi:ATP-dependent Clp protease ATP-binding subunit ClpB
MDFNKFTIKSQEAIQQAQNLAESHGNGSIDTGHLLKGIFLVDPEVMPYLLQKLGLNASNIEMVLDKIIANYPKVSGGQMHLSQPAMNVLNQALKEMKSFNDEFVSVEVLFYAQQRFGWTIIKRSTHNQRQTKSSNYGFKKWTKCDLQ